MDKEEYWELYHLPDLVKNIPGATGYVMLDRLSGNTKILKLDEGRFYWLPFALIMPTPQSH